ncbi:MAG TPA: MFS transporter [Alphaproteobacteria bacterium]|nr:MFS transporter [Alphaproteobacteria bacterium]
MSESAAGPASKFAVFRHRGFTMTILGKMLAIFANQMQVVAVGWQIYNLTENPLDLGLVGLFQFLPAVFLILITGHVADRYDRRHVVGVSFTLQGVCAGLFLLFTLSGFAQVWPMFGIILLYGVARAFYSPALQALLPNLVPTEEYPNAVAWNSSSSKLAIITGPAIGGALYAYAGPDVVYAACIVMFVAGAVMMFVVPTTTQAKRGKEPPTLRSLMAGFAFIKSKPIVLGAISMDLFAVIFSGLPALLPIYARDILHVDADGLGLLRSSQAVGGLLSALALTQIPPMRRSGLILFVCVALFGVATLIFSYSTIFLVSCAALALLGAVDVVSVYIRLTLIQMTTPDEMRGRVAAVNSVFITASNELGDFRAGAMASIIGPIAAAAVGGFAVLGVTALWWKFFPDLRNADRLDGK